MLAAELTCKIMHTTLPQVYSGLVATANRKKKQDAHDALNDLLRNSFLRELLSSAQGRMNRAMFFL